ncbi:MAG: T9SS type A sorting domain-containing protein [Bacteroidia bacterium]|nr:T9SS type A sorting domain-containing protein [Bacteroidia bacterium]
MKKIKFVLFIFLYSCFQINAQCPPPTATVDLDIANVRARLMNGGDMWSDLIGNAKYEVPKGSGKSSLYAGAIWLGGMDAIGNLRIAAQTYRQSGSDFWPGPLDTTDATITPSVCGQYDRFWKINRQEVIDFKNGTSGATADMINWPGNGNSFNGQAHFLAPFEDVNGDGFYAVSDGDYPKFDGINGDYGCNDYLHGDQSIFWIINDAGNYHSETNSMYQLGIEIHCQAFAYNSVHPDLANTTFYEYKLINRSYITIYNTHLGIWTDVDLGNYLDDFVGCDVSRNMAYAYNGDDNDETPDGYGMNPPAIGIDLLRGPWADQSDGIDNNRDGTVDEANEQISMSGFMYYTNNLSTLGNPTAAEHYYNYLQGIWKNGTPISYGGNGYNSGGSLCDFMFPDASDPLHWGTAGVDPGFNWSEIETTPGQSNNPGDRRFLQSTGQFTMQPGELNRVSFAVIWANDSAGGPFYSRAALIRADDLVQSLADNCFDLNTIDISETAFEKINLYPNPASRNLTVEMPFNDGSSMNLKIYSSEGKLVKEHSAYKDRVRQVDISDLVDGVYFIRITSSKGSTYSSKFLKQ